MSMKMWFFAGFIAAVLGQALVRADEKAEKAARQTVENAFKAIKAENLDSLMEVISTPYYDGKELIRDKDIFRNKIADFFANIDFSGITFEIKEVHDFEKIKDRIQDGDKEAVKEILKDGDQVVVTSFTLNGETKELVWAVAIREGKAKIAGAKTKE